MKKKGKAGLFVTIAAVVAVVAVVVLNIKVIGNLICKMTMTPEKYTQHVLKDNLNKEVTRMGTLYKAIKGKDIQNIGAEASVELKLSDDAIALLEDKTSEDDLGMFSDVKIETSFSNKDNIAYAEAKVYSGSTQLISYEMILDENDGMAYFRIPELYDEYASVDFSDKLNAEELTEMFEKINELKKIAPDDKKLEKIIRRYIDVALSQIEDVSEGTDTLEIGEVKQKLTTLTINVDEQLIASMVEAVCDEFLEDEEVENLILDMADHAIEITGDDIEASEVYDAITDKAKIASEQAGAVLEASDEEAIELTLYVNNKGEIQAINALTDKVNVLYGYTMKGGKAAVTFVVDQDDLSYGFLCEGTIFVNKYNADCEVFYNGNGEDFSFLFGIEDFNLLDVIGTKCRASGTIVVEVESLLSLLEETGINTSMIEEFSEIEEYSLALTFDIDAPDSVKYVLAIRDGKKDFASLSVAYSLNSGNKASVPKDSFEISDDNDAEEYLCNMTLDEIINRLEKVDAPETLLEFLDGKDVDEVFGSVSFGRREESVNYYYEDEEDWDY